MSGLTVIEVISKFFVDCKVYQPNECDSDKEPSRKGKNPIFTEIKIIEFDLIEDNSGGYFFEWRTFLYSLKTETSNSP